MQNTKAMTLIEILITIVVFTSGILVILNIITGSLALGRRSRNRTNATMLAKEGLEMMYSVRDTNLDKAQPWGCIITTDPNVCTYDLGDITITTDRVFTIEATGANNIKLILSGNPILYITTGSSDNIIYTHTPTDQPSPFYRTIIVSNVNVAGDPDTINSNIKKVVSRVRYPQLGGTGEVILESFIGLTR